MPGQYHGVDDRLEMKTATPKTTARYDVCTPGPLTKRILTMTVCPPYISQTCRQNCSHTPWEYLQAARPSQVAYNAKQTVFVIWKGGCVIFFILSLLGPYWLLIILHPMCLATLEVAIGGGGASLLESESSAVRIARACH